MDQQKNLLSVTIFVIHKQCLIRAHFSIVTVQVRGFRVFICAGEKRPFVSMNVTLNINL
jgi:hypothetical protein